jgi:hypothetical protein
MRILLKQFNLFAPTRKEVRRENLCNVCRGRPRLCTFAGCPYLAKARAWKEIEGVTKSNEVAGSSPPSVFVGQWGYPKALVGPLVPPGIFSNTSVRDSPESWLTRSFDDILRYRISLVRGKSPMKVTEAKNPSSPLSVMQELVMASSNVGVEMKVSKPPTLEVVFSPRSVPLGPSAVMEKVKITENPKIGRHVERVVSDNDLLASEGVPELYKSGLSQTQITKIFSIGLLGSKQKRRLVPTEWSITAVDDLLCRNLLERVREYREIDEFEVYQRSAFANTVVILLMPSAWSFEAMESWLAFPQNLPFEDCELNEGRRNYASNLAGAYYAAKLPILDHLKGRRKQAGAIAFLEVRPNGFPLAFGGLEKSHAMH